MNRDVAPLYGLVDSRRRELALSWPGLLRRCGYANTAKGLRRLDAIWEGNLGGWASVGILSRLAQALELGEEVVQSALEQSRQQLKYTQRKEEEAAFEPSAYLLGTDSRPSQITIFGMTGGAERWLRIPLDLTQPPVTFAGQALAVVRATPVTPFFGYTTGFVVNYTLDVAVRFDTEGRPLKQLGHAYSPERVSIGVGGRVIDAGGLEKLLGIGASDSL
jgi:hypothetical protein